MATFIVILVAVIFVIALVVFVDKISKEAGDVEDMYEVKGDPVAVATEQPAPMKEDTVVAPVAPAAKKTSAAKKTANKVAADGAKEPQKKRGRKKAK